MEISLYLYQRDLCRAKGIVAALTRDDDRTLCPATLARIVRESGAVICLCNHINVRGGEDVKAMQAAGQKVRRVYDRATEAGLLLYAP